MGLVKVGEEEESGDKAESVGVVGEASVGEVAGKSGDIAGESGEMWGSCGEKGGDKCYGNEP